MTGIDKVAIRLLVPVCAVLLAAPANAGPYGIKFTFSGTFNLSGSFLGSDTTDWSKVNGVLSFVNDPLAQTPVASEFLGVATLDLVLLDSGNNQIGAVSQAGLNLKIANNLNCVGSPNCSFGFYDSISAAVTLTSPIGGLAAGRQISPVFTGEPVVYTNGDTLDEVMNFIALADVATWNRLASPYNSQVVTNIALPIVRFDVTVDSVTTFGPSSSVPEPSTLTMTLSAAALLGLWGRNRLRKKS